MSLKSKMCFGKLGLCSNDKKSSNYEFMPYSQVKDDDSQLKVNQRKALKKQSGKTNLIKIESSLVPFEDSAMPKFHSTKIDPSTFDTFDLPQTFVVQSPKLSSTEIQKSMASLFSIEQNLSQINERNESLSSGFGRRWTRNSMSSSEQESSAEEYQESDDFQSVSPSYFDLVEEEVFVCISKFSAKFQGDLPLEFGDRVKMLHRGEKFCLVQNIVTNQCGYTSIQHLTLLSHFLNNFS